jgi:hypothetical protein
VLLLARGEVGISGTRRGEALGARPVELVAEELDIGFPIGPAPALGLLLPDVDARGHLR